ncbi:AMP-dependent synthetase [Desulfonema ishimotonii]|uniref:AMP-dependent synthetase n=1 Tax=Desulfonema ishimotonii TaxID=45657 RepID=A0A401FR15_9BACT|nr:AMP-binding protein [Desulfonema ishimotonii]GBC59401.1 AMP-dependent synthetase [Desulfonema ishimotonii]
MSMRSFTVYDMFQRNARLYATVPALVEGEQQISFQELLNRTDGLASGLAKQGIGKGDRIAVLGLNHPHFFTLFGAAAALGAIVVLINWRLAEDEIRYILTDAAPKALFADVAHADRAREMLATALPEARLFGLDDAAGECVATLSDPPPPTTVIADDPFCIIYTAAVEGRPRGAVLTHGNLVSGNIQTAATMNLTDRDAYLNMLPLFHITGLNLALSVMHVGGKNVVIEKFDETLTLQLTEKEQITLWGSFPPILSRLVAGMDAGDHNLSTLRHVLGIDGPDNIGPFEEKTGATFWILYGQTETAGLVTFSPASERPGSAGKQGLMTQMRLVDAAEQEVPVGEPGEITVRGPLVFQGFWNDEAATRRTFRNGWHHTGDMGQLDADGYLWFKGRKPEKELIKPGGENVYPAEVEAVILEHPDVTAVSVIGVPDPQFGEGIKAVCVLRPGTALGEAELVEFVAARIARYKKPRYVVFAESLPEKADGSVDREQVKALYGG